METTHEPSEILIPDQVIDHRFRTLFDTELGAAHDVDDLTPVSRRQKFAATMLLIVLAIAALGVASVIAIGAILVAAVAFVVGLVARLALAVSGSRTR